MPTKWVSSITVWCGALIDGVQFNYANAESEVFGSEGGGEQEPFVLESAEWLSAINWRAGDSVDAVQFVVQNANGDMRESDWYGNPDGGCEQEPLIADSGNAITGIDRPEGFCPRFDGIWESPVDPMRVVQINVKCGALIDWIQLVFQAGNTA